MSDPSIKFFFFRHSYSYYSAAKVIKAIPFSFFLFLSTDTDLHFSANWVLETSNFPLLFRFTQYLFIYLIYLFIFSPESELDFAGIVWQ